MTDENCQIEPAEILNLLGFPHTFLVGRSLRFKLAAEWNDWSPGVRAYYARTLSAYFGWCADAGMADASPTADSVLAFIKDQGIALSTAVQFVARLRRVFALLEIPLGADAILVRLSKDWRRHASQEQRYEPIGWRSFAPDAPIVTDLFPAVSTLRDHLDQALFFLEADCGARPHEPRLSRVGGIDVRRGRVRLKLVEAKGRPTGEAVELSDETLDAIKAYRNAIGRPLPEPRHAADSAQSGDLLFARINSVGKLALDGDGATQPISRRYLEKRLRDRVRTWARTYPAMIAKEADAFAERYSGKSFRIAAAAALFEDNATAEEIADEGRWANPEQPRTYLSGLLLRVNPASRWIWAMSAGHSG